MKTNRELTNMSTEEIFKLAEEAECSLLRKKEAKRYAAFLLNSRVNMIDWCENEDLSWPERLMLLL